MRSLLIPLTIFWIAFAVPTVVLLVFWVLG
jgi:hypothetical protein